MSGSNGPSMKDVAARAGVSLGTVSNVLNRPQLVSERTRRRVETAIDDLGFVRNESARQLRGGTSRSLAFVLFDVSNPFFTDVAQGAQAAADEAGLALYLCNSGEDVGRQAAYLDLLEQQRVEGVLITPIDPTDPRITALAGRGTPVVVVARGRGLGYCSVTVDDMLGGDLAVTHLLDTGHRQIAFVGGPAISGRLPIALREHSALQPGKARNPSPCWIRPEWTSLRGVGPASDSPASLPRAGLPRCSAPMTSLRSGCSSRRFGSVSESPRTSPSSATTTSSSPRRRPSR